MTVLTKISPDNVANSLLLAQVRKFFENQVNVEGQRVLDSNKPSLNAIDQEAQRWKRFQADLEEPTGIVTKAVRRIDFIRRTLDNLIKTVQNANEDPEANTNSDGYRVAFDSLLKSFRGVAESSLESPNLLGKSERARLTYPTNLTGATQNISGTYLGSEYHIIDSEAKRWEPDRAGNILRRYDSFPGTPSNTVVALGDGARLDAFADNSITFTVNQATAAIASFDGTVVRSGLQVLDAWLYDGLSTQAGRDRAIADLQSAKTVLDIEKRRYEIAQTTINFHKNRAELNIEGFTKETDAILVRQAQTLVDSRDQLDRQFNVARQGLLGSIALRQDYSLFFLSQRNDPFIQALIDIQV